MCAHSHMQGEWLKHRPPGLPLFLIIQVPGPPAPLQVCNLDRCLLEQIPSSWQMCKYSMRKTETSTLLAIIFGIRGPITKDEELRQMTNATGIKIFISS